MSTLFYVGAVIAIGVSAVIYFVGSKFEEVSFIDKRTGKKITRIRDKKTKKFVSL